MDAIQSTVFLLTDRTRKEGKIHRAVSCNSREIVLYCFLFNQRTDVVAFVVEILTEETLQ